MASYYKLPTEERSDIGTGSAREIRRNGKIPANYYYHGESNQNLIIDKKIFLHAFLDGRDTPPRSAISSLLRAEQTLQSTGKGRVASLCGRFFVMDRDNRWDRVKNRPLKKYL